MVIEKDHNVCSNQILLPNLGQQHSHLCWPLYIIRGVYCELTKCHGIDLRTLILASSFDGLW